MPLQPVSENFDINVDWEGVPDSLLIPESTYELLITNVDIGYTQSEKLAIEVVFEVASGELSGAKLRPEMFVLGNDTDRQGLEDATKRNMGWMNLKKLCGATGVRYEQSLRVTTTQLYGKRVLGTVKVQTQAEKNRDGTPNAYAGQQQNRITEYYPVGTPPNMMGPARHTAAQNGTGGHGQPAPQPQKRMSTAEALAAASTPQMQPVGDQDVVA